MTLSSTVVRDNALLAVDLTNPDLTRDGKVTVPHGTIHLYRGCVLEDGVCHQRLRAHNFSAGEVSFELRIRLEADFADLFEVRGTPRSRRGKQEPPEEHSDGIAIAYRGLDGVLRRTRLRCRPEPAQVLAKEVRFVSRSDPARSVSSPSRSDAARTGSRNPHRRSATWPAGGTPSRRRCSTRRRAFIPRVASSTAGCTGHSPISGCS
jgi:glycogen debranching enzyme